MHCVALLYFIKLIEAWRNQNVFMLRAQTFEGS
jgi:hypothetical protein